MGNFRLAMRTALRLRACPFLSSMHTCLAFVKRKRQCRGGNLQRRVYLAIGRHSAAEPQAK